MASASKIHDPDPPLDVRLLRSPALPAVEIMRVENLRRPFEAMTDHYTIAVAISGAGRSRYRREVHPCLPGGFAMFEPGEIFRCTDVQGFAFYSIAIDPAALAGAVQQLDLPSSAPHFALACVLDPELSGRLRALALAGDDDTTPLRQQTLYAECLEAVLRTYGNAPRRRPAGGPESRMVRRARDLLSDAPEHPFTLDELAEAASANKFTLLRAFRKSLGVPPHRYQIHLRIRRARELLRQGHSAAEVGGKLGFFDQSHFISWFKRLTLVTPAAYTAAFHAQAKSAPRRSGR